VTSDSRQNLVGQISKEGHSFLRGETAAPARVKAQRGDVAWGSSCYPKFAFIDRSPGISVGGLLGGKIPRSGRSFTGNRQSLSLLVHGTVAGEDDKKHADAVYIVTLFHDTASLS